MNDRHGIVSIITKLPPMLAMASINTLSTQRSAAHVTIDTMPWHCSNITVHVSLQDFVHINAVGVMALCTVDTYAWHCKLISISIRLYSRKLTYTCTMS